MAEKRNFRLLRGSHEEGSGNDRVTYAKGDIVKSTKALDEMFGKNKFKAITRKQAAKARKQVEEAGEHADYGREMTAEFPLAGKLDVKVYYLNRKYYIRDSNKLDFVIEGSGAYDAITSKKHLRRKLENMLAEADDEIEDEEEGDDDPSEDDQKDDE